MGAIAKRDRASDDYVMTEEQTIAKEGLKRFLRNKWVVVIAAFLLLFMSAIGFYGWYYHDRLFPGVAIGDLHLGGMKTEQAKFLFDRRTDDLLGGLPIVCGNSRFKLEPAMSVSDSKLTIYTIKKDLTWQSARDYGRTGSLTDRLGQQLDAWFNPLKMKNREYSWGVELDKNILSKLLFEKCGDQERPAKNANVVYTKEGGWQLVREEEGLKFDYESAGKAIEDGLRHGQIASIEIKMIKDVPAIRYENIDLKLLTEVNAFDFASTSVKLAYNGEKYPVTTEELKDWVGLIGPEPIRLDYSSAKIGDYLAKLAVDFYQPAKRPEFTVKGGRVVITKEAQQGQAINISDSASAIIDGLKSGSTTIPLVVDSVGVEFSNGTTTLPGIKELLGVGTSNYSGSPANRRHNIATGAAALNGIIIKSGEEFSTIGALGEINGSTGYLQELVIKENKTTPEYGGGLCQVGTTLFRTVFNAGLPITQRRNHSYRVQYYEPAGTDATIYDPQPDFRFINDTGNDILLLTKVDGVNARFEIWGTKDGRKVDFTYPSIYNITKPGPTKYIADEKLKPGQKKCIEKAHNGADAYFDYKVTYSGGEEKKVRFSSHYVPWRAVCLVAPGDPLLGDAVATSTPSQ